MRSLANFGKRLAEQLGLPALILAAWWLVTKDSESFYWPPLGDIVSAFGDTWLSGRLITDVMPSLFRLSVGYLIALVLGVSLGVAIGSLPTLRGISEPVLEFFRAIPPPVLVPVIMLFAGIGDGMKIIVIAFGSVWPVLLNTVEGVRSVDEVLRDTARSYKFRRVSTVKHLLLRGASPQIATGARQALSIAIILMVISEMFAATNGLGFAIVQFQRGFAIAEMWSGILLLGLIGFLLAQIFRLMELRVLSWYYSLRLSEEARG